MVFRLICLLFTDFGNKLLLGLSTSLTSQNYISDNIVFNSPDIEMSSIDLTRTPTANGATNGYLYNGECFLRLYFHYLQNIDKTSTMF